MSVRPMRVAEAILRELSWMLQKGEIRDPRLADMVVTDVEVSHDLEHAKIFFQVAGDPDKIAGVQAGLEQAAGFIRSQLGRRIQLRRAPVFSFRYDESRTQGDRIDQLLAELKVRERQESP